MTALPLPVGDDLQAGASSSASTSLPAAQCGITPVNDHGQGEGNGGHGRQAEAMLANVLTKQANLKRASLPGKDLLVMPPKPMVLLVLTPIVERALQQLLPKKFHLPAGATVSTAGALLGVRSCLAAGGGGLDREQGGGGRCTQ